MKDLRKRKEEIISRLEQFEQQKSFEETRWGEETVEMIVELAKKGKMLRGALLIEATEKMDGETTEAIDYAAAIELIHTSLLIQDDVIDDDDQRRGQKAVHKKLEKKYDVPEKAAKDMALCAGDVGFFLSYELLSINENSKAGEIFAETFSKVGLGQMTDIEATETDYLQSKQDIIDFYKNKTASYTAALPLRTASIIAEGEDSEELKSIGEKLGVVFQLKDDSLDLNGSDETGKPQLSDLEEGKETLHTYYLREEVDDTERLEKLLEGDITDEDAGELMELIREHGIEAKVEDEIDRRKEEVLEDVKAMDREEGLKEVLIQLTEFVVERDR